MGASADMMRSLFLVVAVLAVAAVVSEDSTATDNLAEMSKEELMQALTKSRNTVKAANDKLDAAHDRIRQLQKSLEDATSEEVFSEKAREKHERKQKDDEKKAEKAKREAKLKKKEKLSDVLMDHGAEFLSMIAAKKLKNKDAERQRTAVLEAARTGARAGAVGPLKKVARAAAVTAVKKARKEAKKAGKSKDEIRTITTAAAKKAVEKLLAEQDELIEKVAQKWTKAAQKKVPAAVVLAEDDGTPNNFVAPPSIHLSLTDDTGAAKEVEKLKQASATHKKQEDKPAPTVHISLTDDDAKEDTFEEEAKAAPEKVAKTVTKKVAKATTAAKVAKAATAAKQAAGKIVPEKH